MNKEEEFYHQLEEYETYKLNYSDDIIYDNETVFNEIKCTRVDDLPSQIYFDMVSLLDSKKNQFYLFRYLTILKRNNYKPIFYIHGEIDSEKFNIKFLYPIFQSKINQILNNHDSALCESDNQGHYFAIKVFINKNQQLETIEEILETYNKKIELVYLLTSKELARQNFLSGTVNLKFSFPRNLKALCKQYLSYFEKFLSDYDVDCEMSLVDNDDITYMVINVDESKIDIDELQNALVSYFSLPAISQENIILKNYNIATQQLIANIEHLKSQLRLANITITQYENNNIVNTQRPIEYVLVDSLDDESKLKLFSGLVKVGKVMKLKFLGIDIEFDIPLLIEKVKPKHKNND